MQLHQIDCNMLFPVFQNQYKKVNFNKVTKKEIVNFTKLPNILFYSTDLDEVSILEDNNYNSKTLYILDYLYMNTNRRGIVNFYLKDMITECGFKCNPKKGESNDQFKEILSNLESEGYIEFSFDFLEVKPNDKISCTLEINLDGQFVILEDSEKARVLNQTVDKADNMKLLVYYCYLKCRMFKKSKKDEFDVYGGRAETCYPSYDIIHQDIGITDETITKYNKILVALDLIRIASAGLWYFMDDPNKSLKESCNIYTLFVSETKAQIDLNKGIRYWTGLDKNTNKIFTGSKEYKNNNRQLNGELGSIVKKIYKGTATDADIARKSEIEASTKPNEGKYQISALLEAHEGELLSNIYEHISLKNMEKYSKLERSLGLVDTDGNRLVDYSYYNWVMSNYEEDKHEYYVNCVAKKKKDEAFVKGLPASNNNSLNGQPNVDPFRNPFGQDSSSKNTLPFRKADPPVNPNENVNIIKKISYVR